MNRNYTSTSKRAFSVAEQKPQPYFSFDDKYPEYIQVQRTDGVINGSKVTFTADTFDPNLFLRSRAYIKLTLRVQRSERNPINGNLTPANFDATDVLYQKPGMVLANSMTSAKLRINSTAIEYNEPRYWQQMITQQHCGRIINDNYLSTSGSSYPTYTGVTDEIGVISDNRPSDKGIQEGIDSAFKDYAVSVGASSTATFNFMEMLNIGCFNFMEDKKDSIYSKSWYKKMSPLIPYVRQIGLSLDFKDISANSLVFLYGLNSNGGNNRSIVIRDSEILTAQLVLAWVKPRRELLVEVPRCIRLQSWYVDHRKFQQVRPLDGALIIPWSTGMQLNETVNIHQIPTYIHIWATINKDDPDSYDCRSIFCDSDGGGVTGTDPVISLNTNSQESRALPVQQLTVRVNVLGGDDIIDPGYSNSELFRFTAKNSANDFPWSQTKFRGDIEARYAIYPSNFSLILGEDDLNSYFVRKGQKIRDFVISINGQMAADDGYGINKERAGFNVGGDKQWDLHVAFFYDRYYIELDDCGNGFSDFDAKFF